MAEPLIVKASDTDVPFAAPLTANGVPVPDLDADGVTIAFVLTRRDGIAVLGPVGAELIDVDTARVRYVAPNLDGIASGYYRAQWLVTFADDHVETYPSDDYDDVVVLDGYTLASDAST